MLAPCAVMVQLQVCEPAPVLSGLTYPISGPVCFVWAMNWVIASAIAAYETIESSNSNYLRTG